MWLEDRTVGRRKGAAGSRNRAAGSRNGVVGRRGMVGPRGGLAHGRGLETGSSTCWILLPIPYPVGPNLGHSVVPEILLAQLQVSPFTLPREGDLISLALDCAAVNPIPGWI